jgi:hypothetical protein
MSMMKSAVSGIIAAAVMSFNSFRRERERTGP